LAEIMGNDDLAGMKLAKPAFSKPLVIAFMSGCFDFKIMMAEPINAQ